MRFRTPLAALLLASPALTGCQGGAAPLDDPGPSGPSTVAVTEPAADAPPLEVALALAPLTADRLTVTDWDAVRARLGAPDLTGEDPMTDRLAIRQRIAAETVALTDGRLADDASALELDHAIAPEDVDWEAHWTGATTGWVVDFRDDLPTSRIRAAVKDEQSPLHGGTLDGHRVVQGSGEEVWAGDPTYTNLVDGPVETAYLRRGCVPLAAALGVDATVEDQDAVLARHDVEGLDDLEGFAVTFDNRQATAWLGPDREDLVARTDLVDGWPRTGTPAFADAFTGHPSEDPTTGRIGLRVQSPVAAAQVVLTEELPYAVCDEVVPFEEPTGL